MCTSQHYPLSLYWSCVLIEHQLSFFLPPICSSLYKDLNLIRLVPSLSMYPLSQLNILINLVFVSKTWSWWKPAEIPLITVVPLIFPLGRFSFSGYSRTALFLSAPTYNLLFSAPFPTTNSFLVLWYMHRNDFCSIFLQNAHRWVFFFFFLQYLLLIFITWDRILCVFNGPILFLCICIPWHGLNNSREWNSLHFSDFWEK